MEKTQSFTGMRGNKSKLVNLEKGKLPPQALDLEEAVLGAMMIDKKGIDDVIDILHPEAFYEKKHQEIYAAIYALFQNSEPIDLATVSHKLTTEGKLEVAGGNFYLIQLTQKVASSAHIEFHSRIILQKYIQRRLITISSEIIENAYDETTDVFDLLDDAEGKLFEVTQGNLKKGAEVAESLVQQAINKIQEISNKEGMSGLATGFTKLDALTSGWQPSDLIIIAGRPSMGKTALSLSIMLNVIKNSRLPVLFFSLEMSKEQIMYRILAMETGINNLRLKNGKLSQQDWITLNKTIKVLSKLPFFIDDNSEMSIQTIRSKLKRLIFEQTKVGLIIIDYLQLMQNSNSQVENRVQELSKITRSLKNLAREFNTPIIALSQLSRSIENRTDKKPLLSDLRESGSIEQDADVVLMIYNKFIQTQQNASNIKNTNIVIAKQRNGPTGEIQLIFDRELTKFLNKF